MFLTCSDTNLVVMALADYRCFLYCQWIEVFEDRHSQSPVLVVAATGILLIYKVWSVAISNHLISTLHIFAYSLLRSFTMRRNGTQFNEELVLALVKYLDCEKRYRAVEHFTSTFSLTVHEIARPPTLSLFHDHITKVTIKSNAVKSWESMPCGIPFHSARRIVRCSSDHQIG